VTTNQPITFGVHTSYITTVIIPLAPGVIWDSGGSILGDINFKNSKIVLTSCLKNLASQRKIAQAMYNENIFPTKFPDLSPIILRRL
jgi:hypothetical protein